VEYQGKWISIQEKIEFLKQRPADQAGKIVDFPIRPLPQVEEVLGLDGAAAPVAEEEEAGASLNWVRMHRRRRILIIMLAALSLLTMAGAAVGVAIKSGLFAF
jgi:hypothetical protein